MTMVHLYWKAEGSSEWVLLRCDLDEALATKLSLGQSEWSLSGIALNYVYIKQSHWK